MTTVDEQFYLRRPALRPAGLRARVARLIVERALESLPVRALYPDGTVRGRGGEAAPAMRIVRPQAFFERMGRSPKIGFGESYMAGDWTVAEGTDLAALLAPLAERLTTMVPKPLMRLRALVDHPLPGRQRNTVVGSAENVRAHYDLSNDLFASFLDQTMTYSAALFDEVGPMGKQSLESAQVRKLEAILDLAGVTEGSRVLEIGTGWGSLAIAAARRRADVTSVTISAEQLELASARIAQAGVQDRVDVRLLDYRHVHGEYDAVVSVEMIEAVGHEFWPTYFASLDRVLAPGGTIAIQAIVMDHDRMLATRNSFGWIQKYIFPGGLIPSVQGIEDTLTEHTRLRILTEQRFGLHYAETLRRWRRTFVDGWPAIRTLGFDETFRRMWEFYLAYSEAGFASRYLDVAQLQLVRR